MHQSEIGNALLNGDRTGMDLNGLFKNLKWHWN
jgi:hypothetical protein